MHNAWIFVGLVAIAGCTSSPTGGPEIRPAYYNLQFVNNESVPHVFADVGRILGASLVPYAVGRPGDQRLVNDRTGGGQTGGNTRDTTVQRGQMMDIKVIEMRDGYGTLMVVHDSSIVDVLMTDTIVYITRPHPDPRRSQVDTAFFHEHLLVVPTVVDLYKYGKLEKIRFVLSYKVTR